MGEKKEGPAKVEFGPDPKILEALARWWGDKLVVENEELKKQSFYNEIAPDYGLNHQYYVLATHHCKSLEAKNGIKELEGVIGVPDLFSVNSGKAAGAQILLSLGIKGGYGLGKAYDGLTHVYLHAAGYQLGDICHRYFTALNAGNIAKTFGNRDELDPNKWRSQIERIVSSPWEGLTTDLTEGDGPKKLREMLEGKIDSYFDFNQPGFQYRLRRLENKFLLAII